MKNTRKGRSGRSGIGIEVELNMEAMEEYRKAYRHENRVVRGNENSNGKGSIFIGPVAVNNQTDEVCFVDCHPTQNPGAYHGFEVSVRIWLGECNDGIWPHNERLEETLTQLKSALEKPVVDAADYVEGGKYHDRAVEYNRMMDAQSNVHSKKEPKTIK